MSGASYLIWYHFTMYFLCCFFLFKKSIFQTINTQCNLLSIKWGQLSSGSPLKLEIIISLLQSPHLLKKLTFFFFFKKNNNTGVSQFQINSLAFLRSKTITCRRIILGFKVHWASGGWATETGRNRAMKGSPILAMCSWVPIAKENALRNLEAGSHLAGGTIVDSYNTSL